MIDMSFLAMFKIGAPYHTGYQFFFRVNISGRQLIKNYLLPVVFGYLVLSLAEYFKLLFLYLGDILLVKKGQDVQSTNYF